MNVELKFSPSEYLDLGALAAQFAYRSVEDLFENLGMYVVEMARIRQQTEFPFPDSEYRSGAVN